MLLWKMTTCVHVLFALIAVFSSMRSGVWGDLPEKPNIVIIYGDDVGYGDLNIYGHPTSSTPHLTRMAREGLKFTQFYSTAPVCSPARASLMTGRLFPRAGVYSNVTKKGQPATGMRTFTSSSQGGMLLSEITLPQALKPLGYVTGMVGKWHLGVRDQYLPASRGFDVYFGCPLTPVGCNSTAANYTKVEGSCMVFENNTIVSQPADIRNIDVPYVEATKDFMTRNQHRPFFFYFASHHTHMPQFASDTYLNTTERGLFGDSLAELDFSVGQLLDHIKLLGIENRTLVVFTADNGPALISEELGGEQGPLKCGKGTTYEGGMREPGIFWWPGVIAPGTLTYAIGSQLDIFVTAVKLAGGNPPTDRPIDGMDLSAVLTGESTHGPRDRMFYYSGHVLMAVRLRQYKLHYFTMGSHCLPSYPDVDCHTNTGLKKQDPPLLFDLDKDPKERDSLDTKKFKAIVDEIQEATEEHRKGMTFGPPMCDEGGNPMNFPCCSPSCTPRPRCCACHDQK